MLNKNSLMTQATMITIGVPHQMRVSGLSQDDQIQSRSPAQEFSKTYHKDPGPCSPSKTPDAQKGDSATPGRGAPIFISRELCANIINSCACGSTTLKQWMRQCDRPPTGTAVVNRVSLLELIDLYYCGEGELTVTFVRSLVSKINAQGLRSELTRLGIQFETNSNVNDLKSALINAINADRTHSRPPYIQQPYLISRINSSDSESAKSETESEVERHLSPTKTSTPHKTWQESHN